MAERRSCVAVHFFEISPWQLFLRFRLYAYGCSEPRKEVFRNSLIRYHGGPVVLDHVWFIDCSFDISQDPKGQRLAQALLSSPYELTLFPGIKGTYALA